MHMCKGKKFIRLELPLKYSFNDFLSIGQNTLMKQAYSYVLCPSCNRNDQFSADWYAILSNKKST